MLDGLDQVDWSALTHAYGSAEDVPYMLRGLASTDSDSAQNALEGIWATVFHQCEVYDAAVPVIPFLVELAMHAPQQRAEILEMIGTAADANWAYGAPLGEVRSMVQAHEGQLRQLMADPDAEVRAAAVYAVAQCENALDALRERWAGEEEPTVRAALLLALNLRDPAGCRALLLPAVKHGPYPVRLAAGLTLLRTGEGLPAGATAALAEAVAAGTEISDVWRRESSTLKELLLPHLDDTLAADLLRRLLAAVRGEAKRRVIWAVAERFRDRAAPSLFVPLLGPALADPDDMVRDAAVRTLRMAGSAAGMFANALARIANGYSQVAGRKHAGAGLAERDAFDALVLLGDPRWLDVVCATWAAGHKVAPWLMLKPRADPAIISAVRQRLVELAATGTDRPDNRTAVRCLAELLSWWGSAAAAAEPELLASLHLAPREAARALTAIGTTAGAAVPHLRTAALDGDVACSVGVWRLTGDAAPLLSAVDEHLNITDAAMERDLHGAPDGLDWPTVYALCLAAAEAAPALSPLANRFCTYLTGRASGRIPLREVQILAARVVWLATGDADRVVPTVIAVLSAKFGPPNAAIDLAAQLSHPSLTPALRRILASDWAGPNVAAVARALWRLGEPTADLVPTLVDALAHGWTDALPVLVEMDAVTAIPALRQFTERTERVEGVGGAAADQVWHDEWLQHDLLAAVATLSNSRTSNPS